MMKECDKKKYCLEKPYACHSPQKVLDEGCETFAEIKKLRIIMQEQPTLPKPLKEEETSQQSENSAEISKDLKPDRTQFREKRSVLIKSRLADNLSIDQIVEEVSKIYPEIDKKRIKMQVNVTRNALKRKTQKR